MAAHYLRFGIFLAPFHPVGQNPTLSLQRDLELIEWLDRLGYDEAWIGEHHSAGYEIIASPEIFIAAAAERTRRIRLGTGVVSLPYHHPLMVADRIMQLDHQTRGRVMFGVGPGALPSDAFMMGIPVDRQRDMMDEALAALVPLLRGETVTMETDWFKLRDARLQLAPYTKPHVEIAVASQVSPAGARAAGKYGLSLLSLGATTTGGFNALASNWEICEEKAREYGQQVRRENWRLVGPMHIAETREKARENVKFGLEAWLAYFREVAALPLAPEGPIDDVVDAIIQTGLAVIGTPGGDPQELRADRPPRHAAFPGGHRTSPAFARLGRGQSGYVYRCRHAGDHGANLAAPTGTGRKETAAGSAQNGLVSRTHPGLAACWCLG